MYFFKRQLSGTLRNENLASCQLSAAHDMQDPVPRMDIRILIGYVLKKYSLVSSHPVLNVLMVVRHDSLAEDVWIRHELLLFILSSF